MFHWIVSPHQELMNLGKIFLWGGCVNSGPGYVSSRSAASRIADSYRCCRILAAENSWNMASRVTKTWKWLQVITLMFHFPARSSAFSFTGISYKRTMFRYGESPRHTPLLGNSCRSGLERMEGIGCTNLSKSMKRRRAGIFMVQLYRDEAEVSFRRFDLTDP